MYTVNRSGGIISINHPGVPSGEDCMGCGWQVNDIPDNVVTAVEVLCGGTMDHGIESPVQGWELWHKMLNAGQRVTAIGGSDDHRAGESTDTHCIIGTPTTVVYMDELSVKGLLDGIRSGRVFVDVEGNKNYALNLSATNKKSEVNMGDILKVTPNDIVDLMVELRGYQMLGSSL